MVMIIALPCIHFSVKEREIINKHGFLSFPQFLDNHYVAKKRASVTWLIKWIERFQNGVKFAICPDLLHESSLALKKKYPFVNWIFPLHFKNEFEFAIQNFDWLGFPYRDRFRNYSFKEYLDLTTDKKRWYLGFWGESYPELLLSFDGFDSTLPETYSGKFGKVWTGWRQATKAPTGMKTIKIFEMNVMNFRNIMEKLLNQKNGGFLIEDR